LCYTIEERGCRASPAPFLARKGAREMVEGVFQQPARPDASGLSLFRQSVSLRSATALTDIAAVRILGHEISAMC